MREIGSRLELFVDDWLIETLQGAALRLHSPTFRDVALYFDQPWEGGGAHYVAMAEVNGEYRCYYRGFYNDRQGATCLATSRDGVHWERPTLGVVEWRGSRDNNIILFGEAPGTFAPFLDTNPAAPATERFKGLGAERVESRDVRRWPHLFAFASEDGVHWRKWRDEPVISDGAFDSQNLAYWDAYRGHYVAFYRDFYTVASGERVRGIKWATSPDFIHWTPGQWLQYNDVPDEHLYTNATISYARAPHLYLAFPKRFLPKRRVKYDHDDDGLSDGVFMSSRDGLHWHRWREAFLRPGREPQDWVDRTNGIAWGIYQTGPDELSIYWISHYGQPTCRLKRGTLRLDGFVSLHADFPGGEMTTHPLTFSGSELVLNYATSAAGSVRVEVQDEQGQPLPGYSLDECVEMYGDEIKAAVRWQSGASVGALQGRPVRLRFALADADVYALQFAVSTP
ncbi:MAG: hypothetical protein KIT87_03530 [Anaerolineae bacterium]|nr:hypothetical protein [Anaerolineae bacterium]